MAQVLFQAVSGIFLETAFFMVRLKPSVSHFSSRVNTDEKSLKHA
jgi:hypothetical protein